MPNYLADTRVCRGLDYFPDIASPITHPPRDNMLWLSVAASGTRNNCQPPVYSLAPELLKLIFEEACLDWNSRGGDRGKNSTFAFDTPIKLSHVCGLWRAIALRTPSLWATINRFDDGCESFVTRSLGLPLSLVLEIASDAESTLPIVTFPVWLQRHSGRIDNIFAEGSTDTIQKLLYNIGPSLPGLVSLELHALGQEDARLEVYAPRLRKLFLYRVSPVLRSLTDLTHLTLDGLHPGPGCPDGAEFISLLRRCPQLTSLCLYDIDLGVGEGGRDGGGGVNDGVVILACLQTMELQRLAIATTIYLISRIRIPSWAPLITHCRRGPYPNAELWLEIDVAQRHILLGASARAPHGICTFRIDLPYILHRVLSDINFAISAVDLSTVASLLFWAPTVFLAPPSVAVWQTFLSRLPSLSAISIGCSREWIENFVIALCSDENGSLCPRLNFLTIVDIDTMDNVDLGQFVWDHLCARVDSGFATLERVRIHRGYGEELDWQRVTRRYESYEVDAVPSTSSTPSVIVGEE